MKFKAAVVGETMDDHQGIFSVGAYPTLEEALAAIEAFHNAHQWRQWDRDTLVFSGVRIDMYMSHCQWWASRKGQTFGPFATQREAAQAALGY